MEFKEINYSKELILSGVNKLANCVLKTMGPNGGTIILIDDFGRPYTTKDGVSVAEHITLKNPVEEGAAMLIKQAAQETVRKVGDGTTTSICLAQAFINKAFELKEKYSTKDLIKELNKLEKEIIEKLILSSKELNRKNIIDVAKISANGDENIANLITDAYNNSDIVKVEETTREFDEVVKTQGVTLQTSYFDPAFINNRSKQSIEYSEKLPVIIIDGHLKEIKKIKNIFPFIEKNNNGLIIVADDFSKQVVSYFKEVHNKSFNIALIKSPSFATQRKLILKDLSKYLECSLISEGYTIPTTNVNNYIGYTEGLDCNKEATIFKNSNFDLNNITKDLEEAYKREEDKIVKDNLKKRIDCFKGNLSIIKVGGNSEAEIKERKDRIDDATLAVKAALESGIVEGGGLSLAFLGTLYDDNLFSKCLLKPFEIINKYKYVVGKTFNKDIIDPLKVTVTALSNAISVTKVIISTEATVLAPRLWTT